MITAILMLSVQRNRPLVAQLTAVDSSGCRRLDQQQSEALWPEVLEASTPSSQKVPF